MSNDIVTANANLTSTEKLFFKFRNDLPYNIDSLLNNYLYFTQPDQFRSQNDESDFSLKFDTNPTDEELKNYIKNGRMIPDFPYHNIKNARRALNRIDILSFKNPNGKTFRQTYDELIQKYYVFCLTDSWMYDNLWIEECFGHNYEGYCIGYKATEYETGKYGLSVKYEKPYFYHQNSKCYITMPEVKYDNDGNHAYRFWGVFSNKKEVREKNIDSISYNFLHKKEEFINEHEYRAWFLTDGLVDEHKVEYKSDLVSCIIFGMNCSKDTIKKLTDSLPVINPNIKFYQQELNNKKVICHQL